MSIFFTTFAVSNKKLIIMKRILNISILVLISLQLFAFPGESKSFGIKIDSRLSEANYVGSINYKYLVGGIYRKDNTVGAVFYVDEHKKTMYIMCVTTDKIISTEGTTIWMAREKYKKANWHLFNRETGDLLCDNIAWFLENRAWEDNKEHRFVLYSSEPTYYILMDGDKSKEEHSLYLLCFHLREEKRFTSTHRFLYIKHKDGTVEKEEREGKHTGWKEVPLEPQYVSEYLAKKTK